MTSAGRGRGWSRNTEDTGLRRPGPPPGQKDELIERIRGINISDVASIKGASSPAAEIVNDKNNLTNLQKLYNEALEDVNFIPNFVSIFLHPSNHFATFLQLLQHDYEQREEIWRTHPAKYLNFVRLMGEVFQRSSILLAPIIVPHIASAIIGLCKLLLDSSGEDEIEMVMSQIWLNGEKLNVVEPKGLSELMHQMREILISKNLSTKSRAMLLYAIDLAHNNYSTSLNPEIQKCYDSHLSAEMFEHLANKRNIVSIAESQIPEKQSPPKPNANKPKNFEEKDSQKHPQGHQGRPRAIRGSGVNGNRDEDKKNTKKPMSNWNEGKKGWGHDDRFERDY